MREQRSVLQFTVGAYDLAIPAVHVRSSSPLGGLIPLQDAGAGVCGVARIDGEWVTVVDLAARLGLGRRPRKQGPLILVDPVPRIVPDEPMAWRLRDASREPPVALLVDRIHGFVSARAAAAAASTADGRCSPPGEPARAGRHRARALVLLDLEQVLGAPAQAGWFARRDAQ